MVWIDGLPSKTLCFDLCHLRNMLSITPQPTLKIFSISISRYIFLFKFLFHLTSQSLRNLRLPNVTTIFIPALHPPLPPSLFLSLYLYRTIKRAYGYWLQVKVEYYIVYQPSISGVDFIQTMISQFCFRFISGVDQQKLEILKKWDQVTITCSLFGVV